MTNSRVLRLRFHHLGYMEEYRAMEPGQVLCRILPIDRESVANISWEVVKGPELEEMRRTNPQFAEWLDEVGCSPGWSTSFRARSLGASATASTLGLSGPAGVTRAGASPRPTAPVASEKGSTFWVLITAGSALLLPPVFSMLIPKYLAYGIMIPGLITLLMLPNSRFMPGSSRLKRLILATLIVIAAASHTWNLPW